MSSSKKKKWRYAGYEEKEVNYHEDLASFSTDTNLLSVTTRVLRRDE